MLLSELFIRITGDTSDVTAKLRAAGVSLDGFGAASNRAAAAAEGHKLAVGRVERALASYVGHALGANHVTEQLSTAFGSFAFGGGMVAGVLLGVGAIVAVYEKLTEASREAAKAQEDLTKALAERFKPKTGVGSDVNTEYEAALAERKDAMQQLRSLQSQGGGLANPLGIDQAAIDQQTERLRQANAAIGRAMAHGAGILPTVTVTAEKDPVGGWNQLREAAAKVNAQIAEDTKNFWRDYIDKQNDALTIWQQIANIEHRALPSIQEVVQSMTETPIPKVDISGEVRSAGDQAQKINEAAATHAQQIQDAIWGAAQQSASLIVGALNIGGGGKGSNLGGAIGSTAGFAAGMYLTAGSPIGGAIGSTVGNIFGSFIGGLFDNSAATRQNTRATERNSTIMAQLLNSPSGFQVEPYRYGASDPKQIMDNFRQFKTRGGKAVLAA